MKIPFAKELLMAVAGLTIGTYAYAQDMNLFSSTINPATRVAADKRMHPPTDITVINASNDFIYTVVPNSPVNDLLNREVNDHIHNSDPDNWYTYLVLQDRYRGTFYSANVCRHAIVTVYGYPGNYRINYDDDLCQ